MSAPVAAAAGAIAGAHRRQRELDEIRNQFPEQEDDAREIRNLLHGNERILHGNWMALLLPVGVALMFGGAILGEWLAKLVGLGWMHSGILGFLFSIAPVVAFCTWSIYDDRRAASKTRERLRAYDAELIEGVRAVLDAS